MTSKYPLEELESLWKRKELTVEQIIGQFFVYLKDHRQLFAQHERRLDKTKTRLRKLEERLEKLETWTATAKEQFATIMTRLRK